MIGAWRLPPPINTYLCEYDGTITQSTPTHKHLHLSPPSHKQRQLVQKCVFETVGESFSANEKQV